MSAGLTLHVTVVSGEGAAAAEAASGEEGMRMEGWLYLIRSNRLGLQYSRKRYFVLEDAALRCFKSAPSSKREVTPARSRLGVALRLCFFGFPLFVCGEYVGFAWHFVAGSQGV